jgi:LexA DNA binding domain
VYARLSNVSNQPITGTGRVERLGSAPDPERSGFVWIWVCKCGLSSTHPSSDPTYAQRGLNAHQGVHRATTTVMRQGVFRRSLILAYVTSYVGEHGWAPTYREIGAACGLKSLSSVQRQLGLMAREGLIRHDPSCSRAIQVLA